MFSFEKLASLFYKDSAWADVVQKAKRLMASGNVTILRNSPTHVMAAVLGDGTDNNDIPDMHYPEITRDDPNSQQIQNFNCTCKWAQYSFDRTRKWKKYEQRPCSHVLATYWMAKSTPLDVTDQDSNYQVPRGQKQSPAGPQQMDLPGMPAHPMMDDAVNQTPMPQEQPLPSNQDLAMPPQPQNPNVQFKPQVPQREQLNLFDVVTPPGMQPVMPGAVSVPGGAPPTPGNPVQLPGTFSSWVEAGMNGELPEGLELNYNEAHGSDDVHEVRAFLNNQMIGWLSWADGYILDVNVLSAYQRMGIATAMLEKAEQESGRQLIHSDTLSEQGGAWANANPRVSSIPFRVIYSDTWVKLADNQLLEYLQQQRLTGQPTYVQLLNPVALEQSGGKIPMPGAQPYDVNPQGISMYNVMDLGYDPQQQRRMYSDEGDIQGAPEQTGVYSDIQKGTKGQVLDWDESLKMAYCMFPLNYPGGEYPAYHPHLMKGWVDFTDLRPASGNFDPFRNKNRFSNDN